MGRKKEIPNRIVIPISLSREMYDELKEIAPKGAISELLRRALLRELPAIREEARKLWGRKEVEKKIVELRAQLKALKKEME